METKYFFTRKIERIECKDGTWLDGEEAAYNTYSGSHHKSNRKARARCDDGKIRTVTIGIPDTFFSIPGHCTIKGKYAVGWVEIKDGVALFHERTKKLP